MAIDGRRVSCAVREISCVMLRASSDVQTIGFDARAADCEGGEISFDVSTIGSDA
jgi:hypothetical protein